MVVFPNAKINMGLFVKQKLPNGYHEIESLMVPVPYCDVLEIVRTTDKTLFTSSGLKVGGNTSDNLCVKAWQLMHDLYKIPPVKIHLHKHIPIGAGLGGGSSDGAFTLKLLNELFGLELENKILESHAAALGSDCPFFIANTPNLVEGRGTILNQLTDNPLKGQYIVIVKPQLHISTAEAYGNVVPKMPETSLKQLINKDMSLWKFHIENDFESFIFESYPQLKGIKKKLYDLGAIYASMSGSGSAFFGLFEDRINVKDRFPEMLTWSGYL